MSQSDYLSYKKIKLELQKQNKMPPVLNSGNYTLFKQFNLENTIVNTSQRYNELVPTHEKKVFHMNKPLFDVSCQTFSMCETIHRPNRKPLSTVYSTPKYVPKYQKLHPVRTCFKCCKVKTQKTNNNTNKMDCANKKRNSLFCNCSFL